MEIIDRYAYAVTQRLPERQRKDIDKELRGLIEDMLEERVASGRTQRDERAAVEEVLTELGDPAALAEKYRGRPRYVIAPELTDAYIAVLKVVGASIGIALMVVFAIRSAIDPMNMLEYFVDAIVSIFTFAIPHGFGWVTAIFIAWSFVGADGKSLELHAHKEPWTPRQLPEVPDAKRRIPKSDPIAGIAFTVFFTALVVFFPNVFGVVIPSDGGGRTIVPFFSEAGIRPYAWGFLAIAAATVLLSAWKLRLRRWTPPLAWTYIALQALSAVFVVFAFTDGSVYNPNFVDELVQAGFFPIDGDGFRLWSRYATKWIAPVVALFLLLDIGQTLYRTYRN
ncbi:permease prefix domain 1-containing protein [Paenibacillus sp.]|uniref:permease prefix domain 1-containing protein n=1 Tax=Paenibacillus sp. TaxID=58172 RepID=UPI002811C497|nr:permease prefix domain 1-containing protein [Paenibacillus sp.]